MKKKWILIAVFVVVVAAAGILSGFLIRRAAGSKEETVPVYSVEGIRDREWSSSISVPVTAVPGSVRSFYPDAALPVAEIYVEEGQQVEAGTPLFRYDSRELEGELARVQMTLENERVYLERLGGFIEELKKTAPVENQAMDGGKAAVSVKSFLYTAEPSLVLTASSLLESDPAESLEGETEPVPGEEGLFVYEMKPGEEVPSEVIASLIIQGKRGEFHVLNEKGEILFTWFFDGAACKEKLRQEMEESSVPEEEESSLPEESTAPEEENSKPEESTAPEEENSKPEESMVPEEEKPLPEESSDQPEEGAGPENVFDDEMLEEAMASLETQPEGYTAEELARMVTERTMEYQNLALDIKKQEAAASDLAEEISSRTVYAEQAGIVGEIRDYKDAVLYGQPVLTVSQETSFHLEGQLNEILASELSAGDVVSVPSEQDGKQVSVPAVILSVGQEPVETSSSSGNPSLSSYSFTASVEEENFRTEEVTELLIPTGREGDALVIPAEWIFYKNGVPSVYALDENGKLEVRSIELGRSILETEYEVLSGITMEDYLALPGGEQAEEGAQARIVYGEEMEVGTEETEGSEEDE